MKKTLALLLLFVLTASLLCSCSAPIIYPEENEVRQWLKERTAGYENLGDKADSEEEKRTFWLYKDDAGFLIYLSTSTTNATPFLEIEYDPISQTVRENSLITVNSSTFKNQKKVFDPYANDYHYSMQVYRKGEKNFRIFFWVYQESTDFYPLPKLLTEEQYQDMLAKVTAEHEKLMQESDAEGTEPVNYVGAFLDAYKATYTSDLVTKPNGKVFYEFSRWSKESLERNNGNESLFASNFQLWFNALGFSVQDWRESFQELGYENYNPKYQVLYMDITVGETITELTLKTSDRYLSPALRSQNMNFSYEFCPELAKQSFLRVTKS